MAVITMKDVSYSYQEAEKCSLEHANLREEEGKALVLCGQSGCGKITILRLINVLIPFYYPGSLQGTVTVMGHPTTAGTICDLAFGAENRKLEKNEILRRIDIAAELLDIRELLARTMFQLSGGEKQKIACGCESVTDNPIVVLDEPSSNRIWRRWQS